MAEQVTCLGRVQPLYKGTYNSDTEYAYLDNVLYNGSTYVSLVNGNRGNLPTNTIYWQQIASKGDQGVQGLTGSFGTPSATASILPTGDNPTISVVATGPDTAKIFTFDFGIPAGPLGFTDVAASATSLTAGANPIATASLVGSGEKTLSFEFGIPAADGEGVKQVDGISPNADGNINNLGAISYSRDQTQGSYYISDAQKLRARTNIGAIAEPSNPVTNEFLYYDNNAEWVTRGVSEVPLGNYSDTNKYLRRKNDGTFYWSEVQSLPSGGVAGAPLIKNSLTDYDVTWGTTISTSDIDIIVNG